jgi:type IV pilus assembly protein PilW
MTGRSPRGSANAGFSLVELMLALALGLVVVTGIVQLFVGNSQTYSVLNGQARLQENARFAMEFISRAARSAGYFGCAPEAVNMVKGLRGNWNAMPEFDITQIVQGHNGNADGTWSPTLATLPRTTGGVNVNVYIPGNGIDTTSIEPGTDVLVLRGMQNPGRSLTQVLQPTGDPVISAPGGNTGFGVNDVVLLANCEQAAVFRVTGMNVAGDEATLFHATSAAGNLYENSDQISSPTGLIPFTLSYLGRSYGEDANVGALETTYFFIAPSLGEDNQGNPPSALWQKVGSARPVELVQGVEDLEVLFGVDTTLTDGISNANQYVDFDDVPDANQVVSLRVSLVVNSVDTVDAGNRLSRTFSKTVLLRNANPEV